MSAPTPGQVLRQLDQQQAALRKVRQVVHQAREGAVDRNQTLRLAWDALQATHRQLASIPVEAANDAVMLRQLHVQRYATALLVRLRRLLREDAGPDDDSDETCDE